MSRNAATARLAALVLGATSASPALAEGGNVTGKVDVAPAKFQDETVVYLRDGPREPRPATHEMDQKGMRFQPLVLVVTTGDTVKFLNHDGVGHEVYSPDHEAFELGTFGHGDERSHVFATPGVYRVLCRVHPEMLGYVFVSPSPYAAAVDRKGRFALDGVPPGTYQLAVWNAHLPTAERTVTVAAGETVEETFQLRR